MCQSGQADEEQQLRIEKLKVEVDSIKNDASDTTELFFNFFYTNFISMLIFFTLS